MVWIDNKSLWLQLPYRPYEVVWGFALKCLQASSEIIGHEERMQMLFELLVARIVIAAYSCLFDLPVHPLHLVIGPGLFYFCQSVLNSMLVAYPIGYDLNFFFFGASFSLGSLESPCRCKQRCRAERPKCEIIYCNEYRQSSSGNYVSTLKVTTMASSARLRLLERITFGPMAHHEQSLCRATSPQFLGSPHSAWRV